MPITAEEKSILRALAREYREYAENPVNEERERRARLTNGLTHVRPIVGIHELPWNELNIDNQLTLRCMEVFPGRYDPRKVLPHSEGI